MTLQSLVRDPRINPSGLRCLVVVALGQAEVSCLREEFIMKRLRHEEPSTSPLLDDVRIGEASGVSDSNAIDEDAVLYDQEVDVTVTTPQGKKKGRYLQPRRLQDTEQSLALVSLHPWWRQRVE